MRPPIACVGAGRMGRGIAIAFAYAGHAVDVIDLKPRDAEAFTRLADEARQEVAGTLHLLSRLGLLPEEMTAPIAARIRILPEQKAGPALERAAFVFEGVPELVEQKRAALARIAQLAGPEAIIASTTSTILVDEIADAVEDPGRFLNAHWLNPPYLVPLVELSPGSRTRPQSTERLKQLLEGIGKVPVVCAARPGYIVPRIQSLAMNEAARMVEEGVAEPAEIDKAIKYGFGFRFAVLGMIEFIDWGGGDILYYASRYLTEALGDRRYAAPEIIERNMREGKIGMKTGQGFFDFAGRDLDAYRLERLAAFAALLKSLGLARPPVP